jgi:hypothetical protein
MATENVETPPTTVETMKRTGKIRRKPARRARKANRNLQRSAVQALRQGKGAMDTAYNWADDSRRAASRMAKDVRMPRRSDFNRLTAANPLVIGAFGLGIGVVLGTLMPRRFSSLSRFASAKRGGRRR